MMMAMEAQLTWQMWLNLGAPMVEAQTIVEAVGTVDVGGVGVMMEFRCAALQILQIRTIG